MCCMLGRSEHVLEGTFSFNKSAPAPNVILNTVLIGALGDPLEEAQRRSGVRSLSGGT